MIWTPGQLIQLGKYQVIQKIGAGGFGLTYLAQDKRLQRQVVIKAPNLTFQREQDYEQFIQRFQQEGRVLAKLSHPNVVRVIDFFQEAGMPCLVMEHVKGKTLSEHIQQCGGKLSEKEAVRYFRQLAATLHTVHQFGLIHCDIHPNNIMLRPGAEPILIDFGSTKSLRPMTYAAITTFNEYFSPYEQGNGDPKATLDVYGLAATLYFSVTGQYPQAAKARKLYGDKLRPPQGHCPELSDWLNQAILSGMALEALERTPSMQAWLDLLGPPQPKLEPRLASVVRKSQERRPQRSAGRPSKIRVQKQTAQSFPWSSLSTLLLGYLPTGTIIGLSNSPLLALALALALAWSESGTSALASALALALALVLVLALAWVLAGAWVLAWALTLAGVLALALAGALAGVLYWSSDWVDELGNKNLDNWMVVGCIPVSCSIGAIAGYFSGIGIWAGLGMGTLSLIQFVMIIVAMSVAKETLKESRYPFRIFPIFSIFSLLGLALGGGMGWWLKLSGVNL